MTFAPSPSARACVDVAIIDDNDVEGDHHFELLIENVAPGRVLSSSAITIITIKDNLGKPRPLISSLQMSVNIIILHIFTDGQLFLANEVLLTVPENVEDGMLQICATLESDGDLETDVIVTMETFDGSACEIPLNQCSVVVILLSVP